MTKRKGPKHPGVVLIKPDEKTRSGWRARYLDPDTEKLTKVTLDAKLTTSEQRAAWAASKSQEIAQRRVDLDKGAVRATGTAFSEAIETYFRAHPQLRDKTVEGYRDAANKLIAWATKNGITKTDHLTRAKLLGFRELLVTQRKGVASKSGARGQRDPSEVRRSPVTVNRDLRSTRTILGYLVDLDLFARLHFDDLRRALKKLPVALERPEFFKADELKGLLAATLAHDATTFDETREEHAGLRQPGTTLRYTPITPFTVCVMLSGMRFSEAINLSWDQVNLDAKEIHLRAGNTKTHQARTIDLSVSPALLALLTKLQPEEPSGPVFKVSAGEARAAAKRFTKSDDAPENFSWQCLRSTCGTYLTNAPGIFGAASAYRSAKQLGHSVTVAEKHYVGVVRNIPANAKTLEAAMKIDAALRPIVAVGRRNRGSRNVSKDWK